VLRGEPGTGKGVFVRAFMGLFGHHAVHLDKVEQLVGTFNAALSGKIIVFADEAFWAGDKRGVGALKRLITEPTLHIVRKGIDGVDEANHIHLFWATNDEWSVPAQMKERRFLALEVSSAHRGDHAYFKALNEEMKNGGLAAFLDLMLRWSVDADVVRNVPITDELRNQQEETMRPEMAWLMNVLDTGHYGLTPWPADDEDRWIESAAFYNEYVMACRAEGHRLLNAMQFGKRVGAIISAEKSSTHRFRGHKDPVRGWETRTLTEARDKFDAKRGSKTDWTPIEPTQASLP
jgi:phage/plasmid-associated DNA primase